VKAALPVSAAAHFLILALLLLLPPAQPTPPKIDLSRAVEVVFAPAPASQPTQTPPAAAPPHAPEPPAAAPAPVEPPAPPAPTAERRPPAAKVEPKPAPRPRLQPAPPVQRSERPASPVAQWPLPLTPQQPASPVAASPVPVRPGAPQVASVPSPPPAAVSPEYRTVLSGWLEAHKRYPEDARQRGEQGRAILRFRVDRYGRVLDYTIVTSTGFADLDKSIENMMRGATLPTFPSSMTQPEIEVSVAIRFGLR
jgi:periplasmic protein TonB